MPLMAPPPLGTETEGTDGRGDELEPSAAGAEAAEAAEAAALAWRAGADCASGFDCFVVGSLSIFQEAMSSNVAG